jgi:hypothetical protein
MVNYPTGVVNISFSTITDNEAGRDTGGLATVRFRTGMRGTGALCLSVGLAVRPPYAAPAARTSTEMTTSEPSG